MFILGVHYLMIKVTIVYDNIASKGYITGWGFAAIIEKDDKVILFDTGWNGYALLQNLKTANINVKKITHIVISHKHWDHLGGLDSILNEGEKPLVIVPSSFSSNIKAEITKFGDLREVADKDTIEFMPGFYTTPQLSTERDDLKEISLIFETSKGIVILCGCSHPGLDKIIDIAKTYGHIHAIIGGFHGFKEIEKLDGIDLIAPCHCTKKKEEILKKFPNKSKKCYSGLVMNFS